MSVSALYLHVPFCARKCLYCDFASWATRAGDELVVSYERALERQVGELAEAGLLGDVETAYVGGGTPSLLGEHLVDLVECVGDAASPAELTCEANPESLGDDLLSSLDASCCTRLSLGIQSTSDDELALLGRAHDGRGALDRLSAACRTGLDVSCDLMCATPGQTDESWSRSLADVLACGVSHVSVYPLQIEEGTAFDRIYDEAPFNDEDVAAARMEAAAGVLGAAGMHRYEVASYARPGRECRHNRAYWEGREYLGLGTSGSGMVHRETYGRLRALCPQLPALRAGDWRVRLTVRTSRRDIAAGCGLSELAFDLEVLDEAQAAAEDLMLAARLAAGMGEALLARGRRVLGGALDEALGTAIDQGLLEDQGERLVPTGRGWLLGNELYGLLWGLAPGSVRELSV